MRWQLKETISPPCWSNMMHGRWQLHLHHIFSYALPTPTFHALTMTIRITKLHYASKLLLWTKVTRYVQSGHMRPLMNFGADLGTAGSSAWRSTKEIARQRPRGLLVEGSRVSYLWLNRYYGWYRSYGTYDILINRVLYFQLSSETGLECSQWYNEVSLDKATEFCYKIQAQLSPLFDTSLLRLLSSVLFSCLILPLLLTKVGTRNV